MVCLNASRTNNANQISTEDVDVVYNCLTMKHVGWVDT